MICSGYGECAAAIDPLSQWGGHHVNHQGPNMVFLPEALGVQQEQTGADVPLL